MLIKSNVLNPINIPETVAVSPNPTREQAEVMTSLSSREYSGEKSPFLQCQLGRQRSETRPNPKNGMPMTVFVFDLLGYGSTWALAAKRAKAA